jgi:hypothetical protein
MPKSAEPLWGTLDLLILRTLGPKPLCGVFAAGPGLLFTALHRLSERGWIESKWGEFETRRRARQLAKEKRNRENVTTGMNQVFAEEA